MESLRRTLASIQKNLNALSGAHKVIAACVVIIVFLGLVLVGQLAGSPTYVELMPNASAQEQAKAEALLATRGIRTRVSDQGRLMVRTADQPAAASELGRADALPGDKAMYFETLLAKQSWMNSRQVNEQGFRVALGNELARMIADLDTVEWARVQLDVPEARGLGVGVRLPKASISVRSENGKSLPQTVVDGIARMVEGSIAGLTIENVTITDAVTGSNRAVTTDLNAAPSLALDQAARVEAQTREKLLRHLSHIPGVEVTVTASVDVTRSTSHMQTYLPENKGSVAIEKRASETQNNSTEPAPPSAVPGVYANQTADITRGSSVAGGGGTTSTETTTESDIRFGSKTETIVDPKGQSTSVAVSVNVPSGYVAMLMQGVKGPGSADAPPDEAALAARFEKDVKPEILRTLMVHLRTMVKQANAQAKPDEIKALLEDSISVAMVPGDLPKTAPTQAAGLLGGLASGGGGVGGGMSLSGGLIDKAALVGLSLVALGLMVMMVKRSGRKSELPSAEELVGLPPSLESAGDVIGEADEGETALTGIEVNQEEMEAAKRLEQVGEMVGKDPNGTAKLMGRWISVEE